MSKLNVLQPSNVSLMIKPVGALCNLDCHYCYYLPTKDIFDGNEHRMSLQTLESIYASYLPSAGDEVTISWQGGEPTLAGLSFFEKAMAFQRQYTRPTQTVRNALQTNGTLINDDWAKFLRKHHFLIGISIDGPKHFHDYYRLNNAGQGTHDQVMQGLKKLQQHDVEYNILCVLNQRNIDHPEEVFRYLLNQGSRWVQFIPEIVFDHDPDDLTKTTLSDHSPTAEQYGNFMCKVFDLWFEKYRQRVSIRMVDAVLNKLVTGKTPLCILDGSCHGQMTIEHNGDIFGCDHFVERRWQLGKIGQPDWSNNINIDGSEDIGLTIHGHGYQPNDKHAGRDITNAEDVNKKYAPDEQQGIDEQWLNHYDADRFTAFGKRKQKLPAKCLNCQWKPFCYGGCPEHRPNGGEKPEPTVLCQGYIMFYDHCMDRLEWLANFIGKGEPPPPCDGHVEGETLTDTDVGRKQMVVPEDVKIGRNDPCLCGSGLKYKNCCGKDR